MKLYTSQAPNPYRVKVFLAEKGIELPSEHVKILEGETRLPGFMHKNSLAEVPVLALDDGTYLTESVAICRYLESLHPEPSLMGSSAIDIAGIDMWTRRMEQQIMAPVGNVALHTFNLFSDKIEQVPEYAETQKRLQLTRWEWLDQELSDGRTYVYDDTFSVADITGMAALIVSGFVGIEIPRQLTNAVRWADAVQARPSWNW